MDLLSHSLAIDFVGNGQIHAGVVDVVDDLTGSDQQERLDLCTQP